MSKALLIIGVALPAVAVLLLAGFWDQRDEGDEGGAGQRSERAADHLGWASCRRPRLKNPDVIQVETGSSSPRGLRPDTDYVIRLPQDRPLESELNLKGGRHVVVIGGEIRTRGRAVYLHEQTGHVYLEGLKITGRKTTEGFNLDQRFGATVVLRNIFVEWVKGSQDANHADLIQTWAGPERLCVDGFRGSTGYQGFFLKPHDEWPEGDSPERWVISRTQIDVSRGGYALWRSAEKSFPLDVEDVWVRPNPDKPVRDEFLWPKPSTGDDTWTRVRMGEPPEPFVDPDLVGLRYRALERSG